jgi:hypothetical protein
MNSYLISFLVERISRFYKRFTGLKWYVLFVILISSWTCMDDSKLTTDTMMTSVQGFGEQNSNSCIIGEVDYKPAESALHIESGSISYEQSPPSSGDHRPQWARWGAYENLSPKRWLHNIEHGGIVVLYREGLPDSDYQVILNFLKEYPVKEEGSLRWILTPYPDLKSPVALITWQWRMFLECWNESDINNFLQRTYRRAPEDISSDGSYTEGWIEF